jgi:iron complex outermembrane receptor protein
VAPASFFLSVLILGFTGTSSLALDQTADTQRLRSAALEGIVRDGTGQAVVGAEVRIVDAAGAVVARATSGRDGRWAVDSTPAGAAVVEVSAAGFEVARQTTGSDPIVTQLAVRRRSEQVVVTSAAQRTPLEVVVEAKVPRQPVPAHDGAEYLETIAGFATIRKGGSGGDPVFRGMAGSRLSILSDGAAILGGCSARMDTPTAYVFPETYDVITVIKGPQTVKYGATGSAGTVLFERDHRRLAQPTVSVTGSATAGAWGRQDEVVDVKAGTRLFYVRGAGSRSASGDYRDGEGTRVHSAFMRWNTDLAIGWTPSDTTRLEVSATASDGHAAYADRSVDGAKFARAGFAVAFDHLRPTGALGAVAASAFHNKVDHIMDNYSLRGGATSLSAMNPDRMTQGGRLVTTWRAGSATIDAGGDWQRNEHRTRSSMAQDRMPVESLPRVPDARFTTAGIFGEVDFRPASQTRVVGGLRLDHATGTDLREVVALSMMSSMPNPTARERRTDRLPGGFGRVEQRLNQLPVTVYAGVGHTARVPDYWELITKESAASPSAFTTRPERTTQLDAGIQLTDDTTRAYLSVHANRVTDFILIESNVAKPSGMGTRLSSITRNVDARTAGFEAGLTERVGAWWTFDGSVAWVRGTNITDDRPLAQIPPLDAKVSAQYARGRLALAGLARAAARQRRVALNQGTIVGQDFSETPGFHVFSANAAWTLTPRLQVTAGVDNLFNAAYAEHISRQGASIPGFATPIAQVREPGRTAWIRLSVRP